jgi:hypothetical protein
MKRRASQIGSDHLLEVKFLTARPSGKPSSSSSARDTTTSKSPTRQRARTFLAFWAGRTGRFTSGTFLVPASACSSDRNASSLPEGISRPIRSTQASRPAKTGFPPSPTQSDGVTVNGLIRCHTDRLLACRLATRSLFASPSSVRRSQDGRLTRRRTRRVSSDRHRNAWRCDRPTRRHVSPGPRASSNCRWLR